MAKAKKIAVINQKGGVGKSTTALSLGAALHHKGKKVLFVDLDAQGNLSGTLRARPTTNTVLSLLKKELKASDIIQKTDCGDLLPSSPYLSGADAAIVELGKERRLRDGLRDLEDNYDYIIFDTPPALGIVTINALTAADGLVIPSLADVYSMQGINQLHLTVESVREYTVNTNLKIYGVLLTRFNRRSIISREVAEGTENTAKQMGTTVFNTRIRECTAIREAQAMQQDIYTYAPKSNASEDYNAFTNELLEVIERA